MTGQCDWLICMSAGEVIEHSGDWSLAKLLNAMEKRKHCLLSFSMKLYFKYDVVLLVCLFRFYFICLYMYAIIFPICLF